MCGLFTTCYEKGLQQLSPVAQYNAASQATSWFITTNPSNYRNIYHKPQQNLLSNQLAYLAVATLHPKFVPLPHFQVVSSALSLQVWLTAIDSQHFSVTDKFDLIIGSLDLDFGVNGIEELQDCNRYGMRE